MKCPGQDTQYWQPGAIFEVECPACRKKVEFFKDDTSRKCGHCGHRFVNPRMDFGCAAYCQYAEQCLGTLPEELNAQRDDLLKDRVAVAVKRRLKGDFQRIGHAMRTARYAERIAKKEKGNLPVILCAAYLKNLGPGDPRPEKSDRSEENIETARQVLAELSASEGLIDAVGEILRHSRPDTNAAVEVKIVFDAETIANLEERLKSESLEERQLESIIEDAFLTESGQAEARATLMR